MRTAGKIICAAICAYALASCMAMDMAGVPDMSDMPELTYPGSVMDTEGTPIEHIKVTIEWQGAFPVKDIKYTDSIKPISWTAASRTASLLGSAASMYRLAKGLANRFNS